MPQDKKQEQPTTVRLNTGREIPPHTGLGKWRCAVGGQVRQPLLSALHRVCHRMIDNPLFLKAEEAVRIGIESGYRHLDCSYCY